MGGYDRNIARDLSPNDIQPWAEALYQQRVRNMGKDAPRANCLPDPFPYYHIVDLARIVQTPGLIVILYQGSTNSIYRTIFTDGRELPKDPNPTWLGYSVGHWERRHAGGGYARVSTTQAGSTWKGILTPKLCALPNASGAATSDTWIWT